jgi:hypothetical protein
VPKRSRIFIFFGLQTTNIAKGRESIPAFMPNYLEQNLFSGSSSDNSQSGALPITYT